MYGFLIGVPSLIKYFGSTGLLSCIFFPLFCCWNPSHDSTDFIFRAVLYWCFVQFLQESIKAFCPCLTSKVFKFLCTANSSFRLHSEHDSFPAAPIRIRRYLSSAICAAVFCMWIMPINLVLYDFCFAISFPPDMLCHLSMTKQNLI